MLALVLGENREQSYLDGGNLQMLGLLSHAHLAQLTAQLGDPAPLTTVEPRTPTHLHGVSAPALTEAWITGSAVLSFCGVWFVPRYDETAPLPMCEECERANPVVTALLTALRGRS